MPDSEMLLTLALRSEATFGRGEGVAGEVDTDIDAGADGLPLLGARRLKGLLAQEGRNLLAASAWLRGRFGNTHGHLFGEPGAGPESEGLLQFDAAQLAEPLRSALVQAGEHFSNAEIWAALTEVRRQTALSPVTGAPRTGSLRAQRTLLRGLRLSAALRARRPLEEDERAWLTLCCLALRRGGLRRNRGRGRLQAALDGEGAMKVIFNRLGKEAAGADTAAAH